MGTAERGDGVGNMLIVADHLDFEFGDGFQGVLAAEEGMASWQRTELTLPEGLPATAVVVSDFSRSRVEHRVFHGFFGTNRDEEADFIHRG